MIKIAIVDDKASNRNILEDKLKRNDFFSVAFKAADGEEFLDKMRSLSEENLPDIVMMDLEMPVMDGVAAIATGSSLYPSVKFVVLTVFDDDDKIFKAIKSGACGYLLKEESSNVIIEMLMNLRESGAGPISPSIAYKILQMIQQQEAVKTKKNDKESIENIFQLSEREKEILQLLSRGLEYKEIASSINISPNTVKKHTINIYHKLHVNSKAQALRIAYMKGLL
jgi:RNA polymerase sigma factor (sigma-70 family)